MLDLVVSFQALSVMELRVQNEHLAGHLPTHMKGLDEALCGGIPFGVLTELVGPAGIGKTQVFVFHKYLTYSQVHLPLPSLHILILLCDHLHSIP